MQKSVHPEDPNPNIKCDIIYATILETREFASFECFPSPNLFNYEKYQTLLISHFVHS